MRIKSLLVAAGLALATTLAGCSTDGVGGGFSSLTSYNARTDAGYRIPAIPITKVASKYRRQTVNYQTNEKPGTIVVDTGEKHLYFVLGGGKAVRYGIGVGREGFEWRGTARVALKREWPTWTPPAEMIERQPELEPYRHGMAPGLDNPLGARALYIFQDGRDTLYRLHGNQDERAIGQAVSSGCVRLLQQDVIDLYERVPSGTPILVV